MSDFLHHLRFWLIAALVLGVAAGVLLREWPGREGRQRWLAWTGLAALTGLLALALGAVQAPPALYLGAAIAAYVAYLLGAAFGAMAGGGDLRAHDGWALGLLPLALLWWGAAITSVPDYLKRTESAASAAPATAPASAPSAGTDGPAVTTTAGDPYADCRRALAAAMAAGPLRFQPGHTAIHTSLALGLDAAASVIRACPAGDLVVAAQGDGPGPEGLALARRRSEAVVRYLNREGLDNRRAVTSETDPSSLSAPGAVRLDIQKL